MSVPRFAVSTLRAAGILLMVLGVVHLAATPHIPHLLDGLPPDAYRLASGPTVLNHVLVGLLLLPPGYLTWFASSAGNVDQPWARRVLLVNSLATLTLPISVVVFMRQPEYYTSPLFVAGAGLACLGGLLMLVAVVYLFNPLNK